MVSLSDLKFIFQKIAVKAHCMVPAQPQTADGQSLQVGRRASTSKESDVYFRSSWRLKTVIRERILDLYWIH